MSTDPKHELVNLLVRKAFKPVLEASPDGRSSHEKQVLEHVQGATRAEIDRFHGYGSVEEVLTNFKRHLTSSPAKKVHAQLRQLDLPTLDDVRDEFEERARKLGVAAPS